MTDQRLVFDAPTAVIYGWGASSATGEQVRGRGATRVLVVTDPGVRKAGLAEAVCASLEGAAIPYQVYSDVEPQPIAENCLDCVKAMYAAGADALVAVGGGSAMDVAKTARMLRDGGGEPADYAGGSGRAIRAPSVPLFCLPTTAGTGSEVSPFAVVNDPGRNVKLMLAHRHLAAQVALVDPELHMSCPAVVTAHAGIDTLTHAIEAYTSQLASPFTDGLALQSIELCGAWLLRACQDGQDRAARAGMAQAATLAGYAFSNALLGLCHAISGPLGKHLHLSHGLANAVLLPYVLAFNLPATPAKLQRAARALDGGSDVAAAVSAMLSALALPTRLGEVGLTADLIPVIARESQQSINFRLNPRPVDVPAVEDLLHDAL